MIKLIEFLEKNYKHFFRAAISPISLKGDWLMHHHRASGRFISSDQQQNESELLEFLIYLN